MQRIDMPDLLLDQENIDESKMLLCNLQYKHALCIYCTRKYTIWHFKLMNM